MYIYNKYRNKGTNLCKNAWCCKKKTDLELTKYAEIINDDKKKKLKNMTTSGNCSDDCKNIMAVFEPTIIILYRLIIQKQGFKQIILSLVEHVAFGTGLQMLRINLEKSGILQHLNLIDGISNSKKVERLKLAVGLSLFCLGLTMIDLKKTTTIGKISDSIHLFIRCLIISYVRIFTMELTGCDDVNKCTYASDFAEWMNGTLDATLELTGTDEIIQATYEDVSDIARGGDVGVVFRNLVNKAPVIKGRITSAGRTIATKLANEIVEKAGEGLRDAGGKIAGKKKANILTIDDIKNWFIGLNI